MYKTKKCIKCGNEFIPNSGCQKTCSVCVIRYCKYCGEAFTNYDSKIDHIFCSPECYLHDRWGKKSRLKNHVCIVCGKQFLRYASEGNKFCSKQCYWKWISFYLKGKRRKQKIKYGTDNNYFAILCHYHPFADSKGYVMEHRLVMEQHIKRFLTPEEVIHHINHIPYDNRIENLKIMTKLEHDRLHTQYRWDNNLFIR